jgi:hypothetical protein
MIVATCSLPSGICTNLAIFLSRLCSLSKNKTLGGRGAGMRNLTILFITFHSIPFIIILWATISSIFLVVDLVTLNGSKIVCLPRLMELVMIVDIEILWQVGFKQRKPMIDLEREIKSLFFQSFYERLPPIE